MIETDEDGVFIVSCPAFKGCHSYGRTVDEAIANIREVLRHVHGGGTPRTTEQVLRVPQDRSAFGPHFALKKHLVLISMMELLERVGGVMALASVVALSSCGSRVDEAPFGRLDPRRHCEVYFLRSDGEPSDFNSRNGSFALTDPDQIAKLKARWHLTAENEPTSCGFEYVVYLVQDGEPIDEFSINGPCGYAVTQNGWYRFDTSLYKDIDHTRVQHIGQEKVDSLYIALSDLFGP